MIGRRMLSGVALVAAGCAVPIGHFDVVGDPARAAAPLRTPARVTGSSCRWWVLGVPLGLPRIDEAIDDAIERAGGVPFLVDADLESVHPVYGLVGRHCYVITGRAPGSVDMP